MQPREARDNSQLINIDRSNIDTLLPTLTLPQNIKEDIANKVNQGFLVKAPQTELAYEDWTGAGYLIEKPSTGESGYMLSGQIAGSMTVQPPAEWPQGTLGALSHPFGEPANKNPGEAYYILRIADNAEQKGTVGERLSRPFQVMVLDKDKHPVAEANVTFTILAGNGSFDGAGRKTFETLTDDRGIALTYLWLDQKISAPTVQWHEQDKKYPELVGENLVDAKLGNGTSLSRPFIGWAFPDRNYMILRKGCCDGTGNIIFNYARAIIAIVEDRYGNGLSNKEVLFSAQDAVGGCQAGTGPHSAMLINEDAECILNIPAFYLCQDQLKKELQVTTCYGQARAQVFMGDVKNAVYVIKAGIPDTEASIEFSKDTLDSLEPCDGDVPPGPINRFFLNSLYGSGVSGTMNRSYPVDTLRKFKLRTYFFNENPGPQTATVHIDCDNKPENGKEVSCGQKLVGSGTYTTTTNYEKAEIKVYDELNNETLVEQATPLGDGMYEFEYKIKPGLNFLYVLGYADVRAPGSVISCQECRIDPHYLYESWDWIFLEVYGVKIIIQPVPLIMLNQYGDLTQDFKVTYQIEPQGYKNANAYAVLYQDDRPIDYQTCNATQQGEANYYKGRHFEEGSKYEVQIILNLGSPDEIRSEKVRLLTGRIYIQEKTPGFEDSLLKPFDYYPNLGTKSIVIRGEDANKEPLNGGKVKAELIYPPPGWDISKEKITLTPEADMVQGRAEIKLTVQPDVTPNDLESIELKFTYLVNDKDNGSLSGTWTVRNNSNVKFGEVLAGTAVFVFDDNNGDNHKGMTPADVTKDEERYFDFMKELLNQVVPRKRTVQNYNLLDEQGNDRGIYNDTVALVIGTFKEHFRVDNVGKPHGDFMKLITDYNKTIEIQAWRNRIVDKYILVGKNQTLADNIINSSTNEGDTGLYELYGNVVRKFVNSQIHLCESYRNNVYPANELHQWVSRIFNPNVTYTITGPQQPMSYSFGGRQTVRQFNSTVSKHGAPKYSDVNSNASGVSVYQQYRGDIGDAGSDVTDPIQVRYGIVGGGTQKWPGLFETDPWGNNEYALGSNHSKEWCYHPYWAGIDCIGFVLHDLRYAEKPGQYAYDQLVADNDVVIPGIRVGDVCVSVYPDCSQRYNVHYTGNMNPMGWTNVPKFFNTNNDDLLYYWEKTNDSQKLIHKGDFVRYGDTHISNVYSERWGISDFNANYDIIHAYGMEQADVNNDGILTDYARKVVKSPNQIRLPSGAYSLSNPKGFGRIKLWD